jgi:hypothetical protein
MNWDLHFADFGSSLFVSRISKFHYNEERIESALSVELSTSRIDFGSLIGKMLGY